ncbi:MAG: hypothetical protein EOM66_00600 [Clostridia bacterium]|nr:amidohydrolase family protein [Candidatus Pelethousia sp.]NCB29889.1 hypothetical protein [Clostridia bacterium]
MMGTIIKGKYLLTDARLGKAGLLRNGGVYIQGDTIEDVGDADALCAAHPEAEAVGGDCFVLPGIIDGHSHGHGLSHVQRGVGFDFLENSLYDWTGMIDLPPDLNAKMEAWRHIRSGCTTFHHTEMGVCCDAKAYDKAAASIRAYNETGIRLAYSYGIRDINALAYDDADFYKSLPADLQHFTKDAIFFDKAKARAMCMETLQGLFRDFGAAAKIFPAPSWAHGATDEYLLLAKRFAEDHGHLPMHIHTLQTPYQRAYGLKKYGMSLLERLNKLGLVDDALSLGHAVYLNEKDVALLADTRASITHHASCNLAVRNGISPVWFLQKAGVNVALGLDEKSINDDADVFMEMRMIFYLSRIADFGLLSPSLTPYEVLAMGTRNAARCLGLENEVGALLPGMRADVITLSLDEMERDPAVVPELSPCNMLIHRGLGRHVRDVFCDGRPILRKGKCLTMDVDALYEEVRAIAGLPMNPAQRAFADNMQRLKPYMQAWNANMLDGFEREPWYLVNSRI